MIFPSVFFLLLIIIIYLALPTDASHKNNNLKYNNRLPQQQEHNGIINRKLLLEKPTRTRTRTRIDNYLFGLPRGGGDSSNENNDDDDDDDDKKKKTTTTSRSRRYYKNYIRDISKLQQSYQSNLQELERSLQRTKAMNINATLARSNLDMDVVKLSIPLRCLPPELVYPFVRQLHEAMKVLQQMAEPMHDRLQEHQTALQDSLQLVQECIDSMEEKKYRITKFLRRKHHYNERKVRRWETKFDTDISSLEDVQEFVSHKLNCRHDTWKDFIREAKKVQEKAQGIQTMIEIMRKKKKEHEEREQKKKKNQLSSTAAPAAAIMDIKDFYQLEEEEESIQVEISTYTFNSHY